MELHQFGSTVEEKWFSIPKTIPTSSLKNRVQPALSKLGSDCIQEAFSLISTICPIILNLDKTQEVFDSGDARITVTSAFVDKVTGICGNLNCDKNDDWTFADGTECTTLDATAVSFEDVWIRDACEFESANSFILNPNEISTDIGENIAGPICDPTKYTQESLLNRHFLGSTGYSRTFTGFSVRESRTRSRDSQKCDLIFDGTEFDDCRIDAVNIARWIQNCKIEICGTVDAFEGQVQFRSIHFTLEFQIISNV